jgi:hypothetical protein
VGDWYYIGHYGQLGPLTRDQIDELVEGGVIARDTYVWRAGMDASAPPVQPAPGIDPRYAPVAIPAQYPTFGGLRSDRSRTAAGIIQLLVPGVGRMYLGYMAYGVLQLVTALCGIGFVWSFIDGIVILSGGMKYDGYGRELSD